MTCATCTETAAVVHPSGIARTFLHVRPDDVDLRQAVDGSVGINLCALLLVLFLALLMSAAETGAVPAETRPMTAVSDLAELGWRLHRQLGSSDGNLVFSPFSISSVFAMLSAGARGETLAEMRRALAFSGEDEAWHASQGALIEALSALNREGDEYRNAQALRLANDLWLQRGFEVRKPFVDTLALHYRSSLHELDFETDPDGSRRTINAKVERDTGSLIPDLLPPGSVSADARLVLSNALYFKAAWMHQFSERATARAPFHLLDESVSEVPTMRLTERLAHAATDDWQAVLLPYDEGDLEMLVVVPRPGRFGAVAEALDPASVNDILSAMRPVRLRLFMPRFAVRSSLPLVPLLQEAGMHRAFSDGADLSGIADGLYVSAAMHEAVIEVDEQGTEAAAATAAVISLTSMPMQEPEPLELRIDRPFLFLVRARASGALLFLGRVVRP